MDTCALETRVKQEENIESTVKVLCLSCQGCMTKNCGGLNDRNVLPYHSGGWKSKIKLPSRLVSSESTLPRVQVVAFSLSLHLPLTTLCVS